MNVASAANLFQRQPFELASLSRIREAGKT
jgi:hypothetical protein